MSVFDDNITSENTPLQIFHNKWKNAIEGEFGNLYKKFGGDIEQILKVYNSAIIRSIQEFTEREIYYPWLFCTPIADVNSTKSKYLVTILYSEGPSMSLYNDRKIFLQVSIPISQLNGII